MKSLILALLLGVIAVVVDATPCAAAFAPPEISFLQDDAVPVRQKPHHRAPRRAAASGGPTLTEQQALHALETEISRKVGLQMKETDYPEEARRWTWSGIALVHVVVGKDGIMRQISVGRTSGFRILDEQAVRLVSRVTAPSWIPDRLRGREIAVLVPIGFILPHGR